MSKKFFLFFFFFLILLAEENVYEIKVTEKKDRGAEQFSSSSKIEEKDIEEKQMKNASDAVKNMPGVYNAGPAIFVRGLRGEHILVLYDGIPLNNPASVGGNYDLSLFSLENISSVELIKGSQSVLYGADAMAGVIKITSKKGSGSPFFSLKPETGITDVENNSFLTSYLFNSNISGGNNNLHYSASASFFRDKAISAAENYHDAPKYQQIDEKELEKDGFISKNSSLKTGYIFSDLFEALLTARLSLNKNDIDNGSGALRDDPNHTINSTQFFARPELKFSLFDKRWKNNISFSASSHKIREINKKTVEISRDLLDKTYAGSTFKIEWRNFINASDFSYTETGLELEKSLAKPGFDINHEMNSFAGFIYQKLSIFNGFEAGGGLRYTTATFEKDETELFSEKSVNDVSWNGGLSYDIKKTDTFLRANAGKGFKTPTLFQLYSQFGNPDLKNQTSYTFDTGIAQNLFDKRLKTELTGFYNFIDNYIDYDFDLHRYKNSIWIETAGAEAELTIRLNKNFIFNANYTRLFVMNEYLPVLVKENLYKKKTPVLRRPENLFNFSLHYGFLKIYSTDILFSYSGSRKDEIYREPNIYTTTLPAYTKLDLMFSVQIFDELNWYARVSNIFNNQYQEVAGYNEPGLSFYSGLTFKYRIEE